VGGRLEKVCVWSERERSEREKKEEGEKWDKGGGRGRRGASGHLSIAPKLFPPHPIPILSIMKIDIIY